MKTLNVAVVGSGPAGLYTAEALIKQGAALDPPQAVRVDVLDRLPTPYEASSPPGRGTGQRAAQEAGRAR
jgi:2-polyprenyl-6-methoxyphenol hydroxylase-like FAD-dependent oxidoreductase